MIRSHKPPVVVVVRVAPAGEPAAAQGRAVAPRPVEAPGREPELEREQVVRAREREVPRRVVPSVRAPERQRVAARRTAGVRERVALQPVMQERVAAHRVTLEPEPETWAAEQHPIPARRIRQELPATSNILPTCASASPCRAVRSHAA